VATQQLADEEAEALKQKEASNAQRLKELEGLRVHLKDRELRIDAGLQKYERDNYFVRLEKELKS
jgi:uncharacterized protein (DUF1684 family)